MKAIRFKFSPSKALAAISWMLRNGEGPVDLHTMLKACYFADRQHLNEHGRPVFGASYRAMVFGPVPLEIYEMAKGESLWLAELGLEQMPWSLRGHHLHLAPGFNGEDRDELSATDWDAIEKGFARSKAMTFGERTAATHGLDWQAAQLGMMRYEDMLDEQPGRAQRIAYLREAAPFIRL